MYAVLSRISPLGLLGLLFFLLAPSVLRAAEPALQREPALQWQAGETILLFGGALLVGGLTTVDQDLRRGVQKNDSRGLTSLARGADLIGHPLVVAGAAGALWAGGTLNRESERALMGKEALQAVVAAETLTVGLKLASGRSRPRHGDGAFQWRAFEAERDSFPSGHTAGAFALASSLAGSSRNPLPAQIAYVFAGFVGASRLIVDDHWGSDVVAGALIGELCGRVVPKLLSRSSLTLSPVLTAQESALILTLAW